MNTRPTCHQLLAAVALSSPAAALDPVITSWYTVNAVKTAAVVEYVGGTPVTTWPSAGQPNMGGGVSTPTYSDVQQVRYSASWVYINAPGLASHIMGPWLNPQTGAVMGLWPANQNYLIRIPRTTSVPATKTATGLGNIGIWVNGVGMFNALDAFSYRNSSGTDSPTNGPPASKGDGIWNRSAIAAEVGTFDPAYLHQPNNGAYHCHASPLGLRRELGDNVSYNPATDRYSEDTSNLHHSPLLGWSFDGFPVYGPYGYTDPNNPASGIRRLVSGYVLRDGTNGTTNLTSTGRHSLAPWAASLHGLSTTLTSTQWGPAVTAQRPLGWYAEDFDFLGDLPAGPTYDLDRYNGRFCQTPEFPGGTYAYFTTLDSTGAPAYPFIVGSQYYGAKTGGSVGSVAESTTTYFLNAGPSGVTGWTAY